MAKKTSATTEKAKEATDQAQDTGSEGAQDAKDTASDAAGQSNGSGSNGIFSELIGTARDAALEALKPVVKEAAQSAAGFAAQKGPDLIKDKVSDLTDGGGLEDLANKGLSQAGPIGSIASKLGMGGKLVDSIMPGDDDDEEGEGGETDADATGSGRRMPVQQAMDVAVPIDIAYNQWTQFEEYPNFMHRVNSANQEDEGHVKFTEKMWNFTRDFEAEIVEQRPNERIVWRSVNGIQHAGVVTFHELAPRLTHIELTVDFKPSGFFEKIGRGARFSKRAIRADMHRFKAYIEMKEEEDGAWRGFVQDGEFTGWEEEQAEEEQAEDEQAEEMEGEEAPEGEVDEEEQPEAEEEQPEAEEEQPEAEEEPAEDEESEEEEEEPEAEEEPEEEAEAEDEEPEEEPEEKPAPRRRRTSKSKSKSSGNGRSGQSGQRRRSGQSQKSNGGGGRKRPSSPRKPKPARTAARS